MFMILLVTVPSAVVVLQKRTGKFMPSSLEKLVINLKPDQFRNIKSFISEDKVTLLMRKGCFPYDYVSGPEKLNETCLPPKEKFYSRLNDEDITDNDDQHGKSRMECI
ncbi:uncharacterized protein TNCV_3156001 [Trichonephila clavipes]|nr:uncharacterized protein TNCV_3156001 [Trichonephila clavipes]